MYAAIPQTALALLLACLAFGAWAEAEAEGPPPHHCGPPPEAFKACEGKAVNARAEFTSPRGDKVAGVCLNDGNGKLVLRPDHPPGGARRGPPPEAYQACVGKAAGSTAQMQGPRGETIQGTCEMEAAARLVLRPARPPNPPSPPSGGSGE
ncbi:MAG: hypothetical protein ACKN9T_06055 [Candidatus Methylumidiphilus sp.]